MWHETYEMKYARHALCHMWYASNIWGEHCLNIFSSQALLFWSYDEDLEERYDRTNELINDEAVCRTAPATPGLLIIVETIWILKGSTFKLYNLFLVWQFEIICIPFWCTFSYIPIIPPLQWIARYSSALFPFFSASDWHVSAYLTEPSSV